MLTWLAFGTLLLVHPFDNLDWRVVAYAVASLTVVRMLPVMISVGGLGLRTDTKLFLGWFGPRGMASIVFAVMVFEENLPGTNTVIATTAWTILLSIIAHGLSANGLSKLYGARVGVQNI
jgi:NhaP-type Na+/H+ or K+/H+ antiporter